MDYITTKLSQLCGFPNWLQNKFNKKNPINMYFCVYAVMTYDIGISGGAALCKSRGDELTILRNKIATSIFSKYVDGWTSFLKSFKIIKLPGVYRPRACTFMFQVLNLNEQSSLRRDVNLQHFNHRYNTLRSGEPLLPAPSTEAFRMGYKHQFAKIYS